MNISRLLGAVCTYVISFISISVFAVGVPGQGTWETTLQGRDLDGNTATFEAFYDTVLDITWLADTNAGVVPMNWNDANNWADSLNTGGHLGWRLPTVSPVNGITFNTTFTTNATSDEGYAPTTTDGADGGWRNSAGAPVSEMGHMFYVTLGNISACPPDGGDGDPTTCDGSFPAGWGLSNTGPFSNLEVVLGWSDYYWTDTTAPVSTNAFNFNFGWGNKFRGGKTAGMRAWAVHDGDVFFKGLTNPTHTISASNLTMLDFTGNFAFGGLGSGVTDVSGFFDDTKICTSESCTELAMTLSTTQTLFGGIGWTAHDIRVFGVGSYSFDTDCTGADIMAGITSCGDGPFLALTVGPGQLGAHLLIDLAGVGVDVDNVILWNQNDAFGDPIYDGCGVLDPPGVCDPTHTGFRVWNLASIDGDGDGVRGIAIVEGLLTGNSANFNLDLAPILIIDTDNDGITDDIDNCILVENADQRDTDIDGFGNICDPDFDGDLIVNAGDLSYLKSKFFTADPLADLDGSGTVNAGDLAILKSFFFKPPGPSGLAP